MRFRTRQGGPKIAAQNSAEPARAIRLNCCHRRVAPDDSWECSSADFSGEIGTRGVHQGHLIMTPFARAPGRHHRKG
jgi:hypothetical protein